MSYLDFLIRLQDQVSPGMQKAAAITDNASLRMQRSMDMIGMHTMKTNDAIGHLNASIKQINMDKFADKMIAGMRSAALEARSLDRELSNIGKKGKGGGGGGGGIGGMIGGLGVGSMIGIAGVGVALSKGMDLLTSSVDSAMNMGKTQKSFEVLTGSVENGKKLVGEINKLVKDTVLGPELFGNAQTMLAFGVSLDKVIPNLKMLGDISMGDQQKLDALTYAFSQTTAAGKLTGQDLLQYVNAGFNPLQEISKKTGKSLADLRKQMEDGGITSDMVAMALQSATSEGGKFNNMLAQIAKTPAGMRAQLEGQWESFKVKLGDAFMPLAEQGLKWLTQLLEISQQVLPYIIDGVNWIVTGLTQMSQPTGQWAEYLEIARGVAYAAWDGLQYIWKTTIRIAGSLFEWIGKSVLIKDLFWLIGKVIEGVWWVIKKVTDVIGWLYDNLLKPILDAIEWVYTKVKSLLGLASEKPIEIKGSVDNQTIVSTVAMPTAPSMGVNPVTANAGGLAGKAPGVSAVSAGDVGGKASSINSGGQRSINITVMKMVENLNINTTNLKEGAEEMKAMVREQFLKVLQSANGVAVN